MSIDKLLAEAARTGGLTALTLWPSGKGWQCNVRRRSGHAEGWSCVAADDPVSGIIAALKGSPVVYGMATDEDPRTATPGVSEKTADNEDIFS